MVASSPTHALWPMALGGGGPAAPATQRRWPVGEWGEGARPSRVAVPRVRANGMTHLRHLYEPGNKTQLLRMQQIAKSYQVIANELYLRCGAPSPLLKQG
jgi:hypothetical protein